MVSQIWPSSSNFVEAIQNPSLSFLDPELKTTVPALDRLGLPVVSAGQFAYVFKLNSRGGGSAEAVRCFRGYVSDRAKRYEAINRHLDSVSIATLASFEYDEQGVLVNGRRYPILVMEWIDGDALDVYVSKVLKNPDAVRFLAEQWIGVIAALRKANVAHGDLQHGNVMVQNANLLRLVDLDGMFVPAMRGWNACELGHRHYQHPKRAPEHFCQDLDNFSALTIYLSLIAIAEQPDLWHEYHDENLILSKRDFLDPSGSRLFTQLSRLSQKTKSLTQTLQEACKKNPLDCPDLLTLVAPPSKLPAWLRTVPSVNVQTSTREASGIAQSPTVQTTSPPERRGTTPHAAATAVHTTSSIAPVQRVHSFSSVGLTRKTGRNALTYAFIGVFFIWLWLPIAKSMLRGAGLDAWTATSLGIVGFLLTCGVAGYSRARRELAPAKMKIPIPVVTVPASSSYPLRSRVSTSFKSAVYVGHRISRVYHYQYCEWAKKISFRNRLPVASSADAKARGFRACKVCRP